MWSVKGPQMKRRPAQRQPGAAQPGACLARACEALDRGIPALRTVLIIAGLVALAAHAGKSADFLFVAGLMLHLAIWFEQWWMTPRTR